MRRLRNLGWRRLLRAVVLSVITVFAADRLLGRRRDTVCAALDPFPGVSCPDSITDPANRAAAIVLIVGVLIAAALLYLRRWLRRRWIATPSAVGGGPLPVAWMSATFVLWLVVVGTVTVMQALTSFQVDLTREADIGPTSVVVVGALVVGSAWLWTGWRAHRTYAWAERVHGAPFRPAVEEQHAREEADREHEVWPRSATAEDFLVPPDGEPGDYSIVECRTCGYVSDAYETVHEAYAEADDHRRATR